MTQMTQLVCMCEGVKVEFIARASLTIDDGLDDLLFFALYVCCPWWYVSDSVSEIKQVYLRALQSMCCGVPAQWENCQNAFDSALQNLCKKYIGLYCTFWNQLSPYISRFYTPINRFVSHVSKIFRLDMKAAKILDCSI